MLSYKYNSISRGNWCIFCPIKHTIKFRTSMKHLILLKRWVVWLWHPLIVWQLMLIYTLWVHGRAYYRCTNMPVPWRNLTCRSYQITSRRNGSFGLSLYVLCGSSVLRLLISWCHPHAFHCYFMLRLCMHMSSWLQTMAGHQCFIHKNNKKAFRLTQYTRHTKYYWTFHDEQMSSTYSDM